MKTCEHCDKELTGKWQKKYCSRSCSATVNNIKYPKRNTPESTYCVQCGEITNKPKAKFCSKKCQGLHSRGKRYVYYDISNISCPNCGEIVARQCMYCSRKCHNAYRQKQYIVSWKHGELSGISGGTAMSTWLRRYLFDKYASKCARCGWCEINETTSKIPLQVEHIDGNWQNNLEENLTLLCPNCHSLTSTFGSLNMGKGRRSFRASLKKSII